MPCWYFEKEDLLHTPSEADGINFETETRYREEGAGFIIELANKLGVHYDAYASAIVYFHRFYMLQSFRNFHRHVLSTSCLLLSSKLNGSGLTLQDLLKTIKTLLSEKQFSVFGSDPQQEVIQTEMSLLETLKFDLDVVHPYAYLLHYTKLLEGEKETMQQLLHMSWTFVNDSLYTTLCVQYEPDLLGLAFLYLACRLTKFDVTTWHGKPAEYRGKWYEHFVSDMNIEILKDICHQVLCLYSRGQNDKRSAQADSSVPRSPGPELVSIRMAESPVRRRYRKQSSSPELRWDLDYSPISPAEERGRGHHDRDSSLVRYRSPHSRSQTRRHRRSYSRSPRRHSRSNRHSRSRRHSRSPRRSRSRTRSNSPRRVLSPSSKLPYAPDPSTQFLSRESFEEIQSKLRSNQLPPESYSMVLPPPIRMGSASEPLRPGFVPPGFQPLSFPPPAGAQVVIAFPYQSPAPAPGPSFLPRGALPPRLPEVGPHSQIMVHQPPVGPSVIGLHPPPHFPRPGSEMLRFVHSPGMFPDVRPSFPPRGLPPDVRGPYLPDPHGPFHPDIRSSYLPEPRGPFPPDIRGSYLPEPRGPFHPDIRGPLPPEGGASVHPDARGPMPLDVFHPYSSLPTDGTSPDGGIPSSPGSAEAMKKMKRLTNPSQRQTNLIYTT